jgi:hypothetical protein
MMEGRRSRCLPDSRLGSGALVISAVDRCIGGNSTDDRGILIPSLSECHWSHS